MGGSGLCGLVLAAGAGRRYGSPKALAHEPDGTAWLTRAVDMLRAAGCGEVLVALGAGADGAAALMPAAASIVVVPDWREGVAASVRAGLHAAAPLRADAVVITPVDTPDASPDAVTRMIDVAGDDLAHALVQAVYDGMPGHPVLVGRAHWQSLAGFVTGDRGARSYLTAHGVTEVECGDLWSGADIDTPR